MNTAKCHFATLPATAICIALAACGGGGGGGSGEGASNPAEVVGKVLVLSNRADLVSGGNTLVEVILSPGVAAGDLRVEVNGADITNDFAVRANGRITGVVTGLDNGDNSLIARAAGRRGALLKVTNHPIGGPVISGPQIQPWVCATPAAQAESGAVPASNASGLSTFAIDAQCNIKSEFKLYYRTTAAGCVNTSPDPNSPALPPANGCYKAYNPAAAPPADLATTTTDRGLTVPNIVRIERGTLNRGIYDIAVLFDPSLPWNAVAPQLAWNGKLLYIFGSGTGQSRLQFRPTLGSGNGSWADDTYNSVNALARGYMVAYHSLTDSENNSNRVLTAETLMMMKEHIIDTYGEIKFTMGAGGSGGSVNQFTAASIGAGLLDGIQPSSAFPDFETTALEAQDCVLLVEAYQTAAWLALVPNASAQSNAKKAAINGHLDQSGCHAWNNAVGNNWKPGKYFARSVLTANHATGIITQSASVANNCGLPAGSVYDPANPNGPRGGPADSAIAVWGAVPNTVFARDTRDNAGVQYGLKALTSGAILPEEFVTLNEVIGGFDRDSNRVPGRTVADAEALAIAYRAGIVSSGRQLARTPIIDMRGWDDSLIVPLAGPWVNAGIHHVWRSFSLRDRLDKANGSHGNHVMWRYAQGFIPSQVMEIDAFAMMDKWLTNLKADASALPIEQRVINARPSEAMDFCYLSSDPSQTVKIMDKAVCDLDPMLKPGSSPRQVAGGPLAENILKCQLKALDAADYAPAILAPAQLARLQAVFPSGVCDWSKPGLGQQEAVAPLTFANGPGGTPLGPAPVSVPQ